VVTVAGLGGLEEVAEDEEDRADDERDRLHVCDFLGENFGEKRVLLITRCIKQWLFFPWKEN
jgi:hypothetical protein